MSNWDVEPKESGSSLYVKLKGGESVTGVLLGDPRVFYVKWDAGKPTVSSEQDPDAKFRFRVNFAVKHEGKWVPKIYEGGKTIFNAAKKLKNVGYKLNETVVDLSREGTSLQDTEWSLLATPIKLTEEDVTNLDKLQLNDLTK